jgi:N utilization substance protein B
VISEYTDIARSFYEGPEVGLVNAVLDRLAKTLTDGRSG